MKLKNDTQKYCHIIEFPFINIFARDENIKSKF